MTNHILARDAASLRVFTIAHRRSYDGDYMYTIQDAGARRDLRRGYRTLRRAGLSPTEARWTVLDLVHVGERAQGHGASYCTGVTS